jgi:hypothetical protein
MHLCETLVKRFQRGSASTSVDPVCLQCPRGRLLEALAYAQRPNEDLKLYAHFRIQITKKLSLNGRN